MALFKEIRQSDGVVTKYHRVLLLTKVVNHHNSIAVLSYVDNESRTLEQDSTLVQPYQKSITYETTYDDSMTISSAYDYLKTLPEFEGATDI